MWKSTFSARNFHLWVARCWIGSRVDWRLLATRIDGIYERFSSSRRYEFVDSPRLNGANGAAQCGLRQCRSASGGMEPYSQFRIASLPIVTRVFTFGCGHSPSHCRPAGRDLALSRFAQLFRFVTMSVAAPDSGEFTNSTQTTLVVRSA